MKLRWFTLMKAPIVLNVERAIAFTHYPHGTPLDPKARIHFGCGEHDYWPVDETLSEVMSIITGP